MINLFVNPFEHPNEERKRELDLCFVKNINDTNLNVISISGRATFEDFFEYINEYSKDDDINIIANADIYFDDTILLSKQITKDECYALCRWDVWDVLENDIEKLKIKFYNHTDSQDVWIFKGKIKEVPDCDFYLGKMGCDNAIAERLQRAGYKVTNPSLSIKTYHLHLSGIRDYINLERNKETVVSRPYLTLPPCSL